MSTSSLLDKQKQDACAVLEPDHTRAMCPKTTAEPSPLSIHAVAASKCDVPVPAGPICTSSYKLRYQSLIKAVDELNIQLNIAKVKTTKTIS